MAQQMTLAVWAMLVALALIWGASFYFFEISLQAYQPFTIVFSRVAFGAIAALVLVYAMGDRLPTDTASWRAFAVMGVLNNVIPFSLIVWGQTQIESGVASILNASTPVFTILLAHLLTRDEKLNANRGFGVLLGFAGVAVLIGGGGEAGFGGTTLGQLAVVGAAISYAFAGIFGRRFRGLPSMVPATGMLICSTLVMAPMALLVDGVPDFAAPAGVWAALVANGVLGAAVAYWFYFTILARAGATNLLLVTFLIPIGAVALGMVALGERPEMSAFAGMAVIFAGLALIDGRILGLLRTRSAATEPPRQ